MMIMTPGNLHSLVLLSWWFAYIFDLKIWVVDTFCRKTFPSFRLQVLDVDDTVVSDFCCNRTMMMALETDALLVQSRDDLSFHLFFQTLVFMTRGKKYMHCCSWSTFWCSFLQPIYFFLPLNTCYSSLEDTSSPCQEECLYPALCPWFKDVRLERQFVKKGRKVCKCVWCRIQWTRRSKVKVRWDMMSKKKSAARDSKICHDDNHDEEDGVFGSQKEMTVDRRRSREHGLEYIEG